MKINIYTILCIAIPLYLGIGAINLMLSNLVGYNKRSGFLWDFVLWPIDIFLEYWESKRQKK